MRLALLHLRLVCQEHVRSSLPLAPPQWGCARARSGRIKVDSLNITSCPMLWVLVVSEPTRKKPIIFLVAKHVSRHSHLFGVQLYQKQRYIPLFQCGVKAWGRGPLENKLGLTNPMRV